jgi:hypothetical protein
MPWGFKSPPPHQINLLRFNLVEARKIILDKKVGETYNSRPVDAGWSSLVARRAHNPKVVGSNPAPATIFTKEPTIVGFFARWQYS